MIDTNVIQRLKQTNISHDVEKTQKRCNELWKAASRSQKHAIEEDADVARATLYRVYKTGSISAKLTVPMAQHFDVDPDYLIGATDEPGKCTDEKLEGFLKNLGYDYLFPFKTGTENAKSVENLDDAEIDDIISNIDSDSTAADLGIDDLNLLLQCLLLREKAGVRDAMDKASKLRALLLS